MTAKLTPEQSREHARLLRDLLRAQERYTSLLPQVAAVGAGREPPAFGEEELRQVEEADRERLLAREALHRFRAGHGMR